MKYYFRSPSLSTVFLFFLTEVSMQFFILQGRAACEISSVDELVMSELLFQNIFHNMDVRARAVCLWNWCMVTNSCSFSHEHSVESVSRCYVKYICFRWKSRRCTTDRSASTPSLWQSSSELFIDFTLTCIWYVYKLDRNNMPLIYV